MVDFEGSIADRAKDIKEVGSVQQHESNLKPAAYTLSRKQTLSAYFTISAAAFGLISDGCKLRTAMHVVIE